MCMLIKAGFSSSDGLNDHDWHKPYDLNDRNICVHCAFLEEEEEEEEDEKMEDDNDDNKEEEEDKDVV